MADLRSEKLRWQRSQAITKLLYKRVTTDFITANIMKGTKVLTLGAGR